MSGARTTRTLLLALALAAAAAADAGAGEDAGLRSVFARGAGERALALGGAYGALADDVTSPFWNPAGLGRVDRTAFQAAHTDLIGLGFYEQYGSVAVPSWRLGTFALSLRRFGTDGIEGRDDRGAVTATDLDSGESEVAFAFGRGLGEAWTAGVALKYQQQSVAGAKGSGVGLDVGVQARPFLAGGATSPLLRSLRLGLALRNVVEPSVRLLDEDVPDPMGVRAGLACGLPLGERIRALAACDVEKTRDMDARTHAGVELVLMDLLALRAGSNDGTLAAGAGVRWRDFVLDYAFEDNELEPVHRFGLGMAFGPTTGQMRLAAQEKVERELEARLAQAFRSDADRRTTAVVESIESALADDDPEQALQQVRALRVLTPGHPRADELEARALRARGAAAEGRDDLAGAALAYRQCLRLAPGDADARAGLARVNAESDRRAARSQELRDLYDQGMAAYAAGDLEAARVAFEQITRMAEGEHEASRLLESIEDAIRTRDRVEAAREQAAATAARARDTAPPSAPQAAGARNAPAPGPAPSAAASRPRGWETLDLQRRAEIADLYRRGVDSAEAGRRNDAIRYWELVWSAAPDYRQVTEHLKQEYLAQGMEAFADGRLERAIDIWEKALEVAPDDARVHGYLERAYEHKARIRVLRNGE